MLNLATRGEFTKDGLIDMCLDVFDITDENADVLLQSIGANQLLNILGKGYEDKYLSEIDIAIAFYRSYNTEDALVKAFFINTRDMDNGRYNQVYRRDVLPTGEISAIAYVYEKE